MSSGGRDRILTAAMFTDIVGSTELAAEMGDVAWKRLLRAHHEAMRRLVRTHRGRIVDTAGDGVFAIFDQPTAAVSCAFAAVIALREIGIEIRAGVHFGEGESLGRKVSGIGVHTASRVMSLAGPGEVLVTSTVRDLVAGRRIITIDRGKHTLKGIPGSWEVFAVREVDGVGTAPRNDPDVAAGIRERFQRAEPIRLRRKAVLFGLPIVLLLVVAVTASRLGPEGSAPQPSANLIRVAMDGGHEEARIHVGSIPTSVVTGEGSVWVASFDDETVYRIDPITNRVQAKIRLTDSPQELAIGEGSVWVTTSRSLFRIDPASNTVGEGILLGRCPELEECTSDVAVLAGSLWASHADRERIVHVDAASRLEVDRIQLPSAPLALATGHDAVWVLLDGSEPTVGRLDPSTDTLSSTALLGTRGADPACRGRHTGYAGELCVAIAVSDRSVWVAVATGFGSQLWELDPLTGEKRGEPIALGCCATSIAPFSAGLIGELWVGRSDGFVSVVTEVSPGQGREIDFTGSVTDVAIGYDAVWITVDPRDPST